jgi:hypothetical protein
MRRRLYFLIPNNAQARAVAADLQRLGINERQIHALGGTHGADLEGLPRATARQRQDAGRTLERVLWDGNLSLFFAALALFVFSLYMGSTGTAALMVAIMVATFVMGVMATWLPDVHLDEFRDALRHGEILIMVDVARNRVSEIEELMHKHHPEATVGGVGWTFGALGM